MRAQTSSTRVELRSTSAPVTSPRSPVSALGLGPAIEIDSDATLADAAWRMQKRGVSALLVVPGGAIVTERDLALGLALGRQPVDPVSTVATPRPLTIDDSATVVRAAAMMLNEHVRHLVVRMPGGVSGIVSLRDLTAVLLQVATPELWLASLRVTIDDPSEIWLG